MTKNTASTENKILVEPGTGLKHFSRRKFLNYTAASAGLAVFASACSKDDNNSGVDLGSGDTGILNYAYALEQLEAAFYIQVIKTPYTNMSADEKSLLTDIRDHEVAHREFFKAALAGSAIPALEVNFTSINFSDRNSVLGTAKAFEDLGVSAYNGAGQLLVKSDFLVVAGKIVSVEARHAALIRDLISNGSFVGNSTDDMIIDATGRELARTPAQVLAIAGTYITTKINPSNLPS